MNDFSRAPRNRLIALWLSLCALLVVFMIILGGATRLTESGLSITKWKPVTGILPPLTEKAWVQEFQNYQKFPEYSLKHQDMNIDGFKFIFWMEYSHRLLGRILGLFFLLPLVFFWKSLIPSHKKRMVTMAGLLLLQGGMGWYMVKSGLVDNPYVSHFRLAAHLFLALILLGFFLWTILDVQEKSRAFPSHIPTPSSSCQKKALHILCMLVLLTIIYGAFVAGLRAGRLYNTFPLMGGDFIPGEFFALSPPLLNFFENPVTVQWTHRMLGMITLFIGLGVAWGQRSILLGIALILQVLMGIATLIYIVPINLALLHQMGAVLLFCIVLRHMWEVKKSSKI